MSENTITVLTEQQAKDLLNQMLANGFGVSGHLVSNGADYYRCTCCLKTKDTQGYADAVGLLTDVDHDPNCSLIQLAKWASALPNESIEEVEDQTRL